MFYSAAFSDSIRLPCGCRSDHTVPLHQRGFWPELNLQQVGNFEIARAIDFVSANHSCCPPMARWNSRSERLLRAARRTRDEQISSAHPLAVVVTARLPHFA
jgi:hypothetical protein